MNKKPILSICIPTYNGASSFLRQVLSTVLGIAEEYDGEIEVIVSDNASSDGTDELLTSFKDSPFFRHYRNSHNLGFNGNMLLLLDHYANGEYSWMIGDDDIIQPQSIPFILNLLKETSFDYLSVGYKYVTSERIALELQLPAKYSIKYGTYASVIDRNCLRGNTLATFMGASIFKTSHFKMVKKDNIKNSFDTFFNIFPNAYILVTAFHDKNCAYIPEPVVFSVEHKKGWSNEENANKIISCAIVDMCRYFIELGIRRTELQNTRNRIIYDNIMNGCHRLIRKQSVNPFFYKSVALSIFHPRVFLHLFVNIYEYIMHKEISDIG